MRPVIFLNGPPRSGKDTLGAELARLYPGFEVVKFAKVLKERTHAAYGRSELPHDHFEDSKDLASKFFLGLTPRQAYIHFSETFMKPVHGDDVWGTILIAEMEREFPYARGFIITDSGFAPEAIPLLHHFGAENCVLVQIQAEGRGCSFKGDSRSYIDLPIETIEVSNHGRKEVFLAWAATSLRRILQPMLAETAI